jgi:uncharacterized OB-fold protein
MAGGDPAAAFPVPVPDADTRPFWDGCRSGELRIPRCGRCGQWIWQPRPLCWRCQAPDPEWTRVSGAGRVVSWTVIRPPTLPAYAELAPFVVLLVELDEGVRLLGYLVDEEGRVPKTDGCAEGVAMGARAELRFHDQADTILPCWTLAGGSASRSAEEG